MKNKIDKLVPSYQDTEQLIWMKGLMNILISFWKFKNSLKRLLN